MVSFHIQLDVGTPLRWVESLVGNTNKPLSDRYRNTMRELDMVLLRILSTILALSVTVLTVILIPHAATLVETFVSEASRLTTSIPTSMWTPILYQVALAVWFMI